MTIDAHHHFWQFDPVKHSWISDEMSNIRRDFLPEQLAFLLRENGIKGSVVVQTDQSERETEFLVGLSARYDFIKGVVGWVDLQSPRVCDRLWHYSQFRALKGFRHILQGEAQRDLCLQKSFMNGVGALGAFDFTYDILILPDQLQYIPDFVSAFPNQRFVIDHLAKPDIRSGDISAWEKDIRSVAKFENVSCKISGMVTEADLKHWKDIDIRPYMDVVCDAFGVKRIMYGSDWPVCLVAADYTRVYGLVKSYFSTFSADEQALFFGQNAADFYRL